MILRSSLLTGAIVTVRSSAGCSAIKQIASGSIQYLDNCREIEINLAICLLVRSLGPYRIENVLVDRFEMVGKTHDLKPVAITDGPNLQIAPAPVDVHVPGSLIHG
jgi:hypothetical protein